MKKGWINTTPITQEKKVKICSTTKVEFGNRVSPPGKVFILKFNDTNRNGIQDDGELPLSNWGFRIKCQNGSVIIRHTDEHGKIIQKLASNAEYEITEHFRVGWNNTTPRVQSVYIEPEKVTPVTFGNYIKSGIIICKFNNTNGNSIKEDRGRVLEGWDFRITGPSGDIIITTDKNGEAIFDDAIPGQYVITEEERDDWINITPRVQKVEVKEGQMVKAVFRNRIPIPPPVVEPCIEYGIYMNSMVAPRIHNNSDENLRVEKYLEGV